MARSGFGTIPAGVTQYFVTDAGVAPDSFVGVSLTSDPGDIAGGAVLECVHKKAGVGFMIELINAPQNNTDFDYKLA